MCAVKQVFATAERLGVAVPAVAPEELRAADDAAPAGGSADRALSLAAAHAHLWPIDPDKIGAMDQSQLPLFTGDGEPSPPVAHTTDWHFSRACPQLCAIAVRAGQQLCAPHAGAADAPDGWPAIALQPEALP